MRTLRMAKTVSRFVAYYRVSTAKQGASGLGLDAQRAAVADYLDGGSWTLMAEHAEVESGKHADRPALAQALHDCKLMGATLVIAKLDRLSRDAHFLLGLEKAGVDFVAVDMPNANRLTVRLMAVIAQEEREMISARTKAALAAAKARGVRLGGKRPNQRKVDPALGSAALVRASDEFARRVGPVIAELRQHGMSLRQIAAELTRRGIRTMRGGKWTAMRVRSVLLRGAPVAAESAQPALVPTRAEPPALPHHAYRPPGAAMGAPSRSAQAACMHHIDIHNAQP
jgi:DNA invertase Pin-like site-specific DNA recombinase